MVQLFNHQVLAVGVREVRTRRRKFKKKNVMNWKGGDCMERNIILMLERLEEERARIDGRVA